MVTDLEQEVLRERKSAQEVPTVIQKESIDLSEIVAPVFELIPPATKAGRYIDEGLRSWAFIAISAIADEIACADMSVFKRSGDDWVENTNNQILNTLNYPNRVQTREDLFWLMTVYLLAEGEAPILLNNSKNPTEMVLLNPNKVEVKWSKEKVIEGYMYQQANGQKKFIERDLMIFIKIPSVDSPFRGMGIMRYIAQTLDIDNYIEEYLRKFFFNDATPGSVLETDKELSQESYDRMAAILKNKHQGVKKAHKNLILEGGLKWKDIGVKLSDLKIKELEDSIRDKILAAFKVPKSILGITEDVNRANGDTSDRVFSKRSIKPKMRLIESQLNMFFVSKFADGQNYWIGFDNPVKEDEKIQAEVDNIYVTAGILTVNEVRNRMELPPIEEVTNEGKPTAEPDQEEQADEEKTFTPRRRKHQNPMMINRYKAMTLSQREKAIKKTQEEKGVTLADVMIDLLRLQKSKPEVKNKEFDEEAKKEYHQKKLSFTEKIEADYVKALMGYFSTVSDRVTGSLKAYKKKAARYELDPEEEAEIVAKLSVPFLEDTIVRESAIAYALVGIPNLRFDAQDTIVRRFIDRHVVKLGKTVTETTEKDVNQIIKDWNEEGADIATLKNMLKEYFSDSKRADMIARTEVSRAAGFAQEQVYEDVGAEYKQWITAEDERLCEFCSELDGKIVAIGDSYFQKGDEVAGANGGILSVDYESISGAPLHPNCRCDLVPVFGKKDINMSEFRKKNAKRLKLYKKIAKIEAKEK